MTRSRSGKSGARLRLGGRTAGGRGKRGNPMKMKHVGALVTGAIVGLLGLAAMPPAVAVPNIAYPGIVNEVPGEITPNVQNDTVLAIARVGTKVVIGGDFTSVMNRDSTTSVSRPYILAFDQATGAVDTGFAPVLD